MTYDGTSNFSADLDLAVYEQNITALLPEGAENFAPQHAAARDAILRFLADRFSDDFRDPVTLVPNYAIIHSPARLKKASCLYALFLVHNAMVNHPGDVYEHKAGFYYAWYLQELYGLALELDRDGDGVAEKIASCAAVRLDRA